MLSINILPNILKHQSDGSHYHERKTKHFNRKQYKNHEKNRKDNNQQKNFIQGFETPIRWFKVQFWEKT